MVDARSPGRRRLSGFAGHGYDKGAPVWKQALWFATQNLLFSAWWIPLGMRPVLLRWFGARIGSRVRIKHRVRVLWPWKLQVGDDSWIGEGVWLLNLEPIVIGADVCISQEAFLCTGSHDRHSETFEYDNAPIDVADGAWIAAQALILRGVSIGAGAVVGARAVVRSTVDIGTAIPPGSVHLAP